MIGSCLWTTDDSSIHIQHIHVSVPVLRFGHAIEIGELDYPGKPGQFGHTRRFLVQVTQEVGLSLINSTVL